MPQGEYLNQMRFPIICITNNYLRVEKSLNTFQVTTVAGLNNGIYKNITVIDSSGKVFKVKNARKLHGVGIFGGYNIFLNQKIKVCIEFESETGDLSLDDFKDKIWEQIKKEEHFWSSAWNMNELKAEIDKAEKYEDVMELLV